MKIIKIRQTRGDKSRATLQVVLSKRKIMRAAPYCRSTSLSLPLRDCHTWKRSHEVGDESEDDDEKKRVTQFNVTLSEMLCSIEKPHNILRGREAA